MCDLAPHLSIPWVGCWLLRLNHAQVGSWGEVGVVDVRCHTLFRGPAAAAAVAAAEHAHLVMSGRACRNDQSTGCMLF
jgi:hypothetical protein